MLTFYLASILALFLASLCSATGPGPAHSVRISRYEVWRRAGTEVDEKRGGEEKRKEEEGWATPLLKPKGPHLPGGEKLFTV